MRPGLGQMALSCSRKQVTEQVIHGLSTARYELDTVAYSHFWDHIWDAVTLQSQRVSQLSRSRVTE